MRANCLHPKGFCRVVSREQNMYSEFCRVEIRVVRALAGDEGVETGLRGFPNERAASARKDTNRLNAIRAPGQGPNCPSPDGRRHDGLELVDRDRLGKLAPDANILTLVAPESSSVFSPQPPSQERAVSHLKVGVERQVDAVQSDVRIEERTDPAT